MKKSIFFIICSLFIFQLTVIVQPQNVFAATTSDGYEYSASGTTATITRYTGSGGNITIPKTINNGVFNYTVTSIGDSAFMASSNITSVTIPNSVTSIGTNTFWGCSSLVSVTIPDSVTSIGDSAFYACNNLKNVTIADSVISIGDSAFSGCNNLTSVTIPNSITSIGDRAFWGCNKLTNIEVDSSNEYYSSIDGVLFNKSADSIITFPGGKAGEYIIPNSVANIGNSAFSYCNNLISVTIPDSVINIGESAFSGSGVEIIYIGNKVSSIGLKAFSFCFNLRNIEVEPSNEYYTSINGVLFNRSVHLIIAFPGGKGGAYIIPDTVTSIGDNAFYGCSSLTSVTIPDSVISIGDSAFSDCNGLSVITMGNNVTSIGDSAFGYCNYARSVTVPDSVTHIGDRAFEGCSRLISVTIGNGVTSIGDSTFYDCYALTSVTIPEGVTNIGDNAFLFCTSLTSVTIPDSVTNIGYYAFAYCNSLNSVTIPASVTNIDEYAFYNCSMLTEVQFLGNAPNVGSTAFSYSSSKFIVYYLCDKTGFTNPWYGRYKTQKIGIEVTTPPSKVEYTVGQSLDLTGLVVTGYYYDGTTGVIPISMINISGFDSSALVEGQVVTITINGKTTTFTVDIIEKTYTATFNSNGGTTIANQTASNNTTITAPPVPTKTGYTFGGWYKEAGCINAWDFITDKVTSDMTLYAKWTINNYTITFNSQGGNEVTSETADYNNGVSAPTEPTKAGYIFGGWYNEAGCINAWDFITDKVTSDMTLYAKWTINNYTVTFNSQGGSIVTNETADYNSLITVPTAPTKTGYTFGGWYKETGCINAWDFITDKVTVDTKLYAKWIVVAPAIPTSVKAVPSSYYSINIRWSGVTGASGYEVYRATSSAGEYDWLATTAAASYNNTGLTTNSTYYYKARAYRTVGTDKVYSGFSAVISAKPIPTAPKVSLVGLSNNPAIEGVAQQFILTSKGYNGKVQYQVFSINFDNPNRKNPLAWKKIQDWTAAVEAKTPFVYSVPNYSAGHYSFAIRVKRAGYTKYQTVGYNAAGEYDDAYAFEYTFKVPGTLDVSNIKLDKNVYSVNEKITVTGLNEVNTYRLHTFIEGAAAPVWSKSPVATGRKLEWMPTAPGSYVLDVQVLDVSGKIIGWKLLIAKVEEFLKVQ